MSAFLQLLLVEVRRYLSRRAVLLLLIGCVAVPVAVGVITIFDTRPPSDAELAWAEQQVERDRQDPAYQDSVRACVERPEEWGVTGTTPAEVEEQCREQSEPQVQWYIEYNVLDLDRAQDESGVAVASLVAILLLLAGTTFTGHDWNSGSVSNQLLFEPRRGRVWAAKALVVTGAALLAAGVVMTSYWAGLGLVASSRDLLEDGQLLDAFQMGWRSAGVAAAASLLGFVLTMLFRSTVATIGILLGASVAGSLLLFALGVSERWNPAINLAALIENGTTFYSEEACSGDPEFAQGELDEEPYYSEPCEQEVTFTDASLYLGSLLLVGGVASAVSFGRRDVP